jgi:hypothetical protein
MLTFVYYYIPDLMYWLSEFEKHHSTTATEASASWKYYIFSLFDTLIWVLLTMIVTNVIAGTTGDSKSVEDALYELNWASFGAFYGNLFIVFGLVNNGVRISMILEWIPYVFRRKVSLRSSIVTKSGMDEPETFDYWVALCDHCTLVVVLCVWAPIVPLVLPLSMVYFFIDAAIDKIELHACCCMDLSSDARIIKRLYLFICIGMCVVHALWVCYLVPVSVVLTFRITRAHTHTHTHTHPACASTSKMFFFWTHGSEKQGTAATVVFSVLSVMHFASVFLFYLANWLVFSRSRAGKRGMPAAETNEYMLGYLHPGVWSPEEISTARRMSSRGDTEGSMSLPASPPTTTASQIPSHDVIEFDSDLSPSPDRSNSPVN